MYKKPRKPLPLFRDYRFWKSPSIYQRTAMYMTELWHHKSLLPQYTKQWTSWLETYWGTMRFPPELHFVFMEYRAIERAKNVAGKGFDFTNVRRKLNVDEKKACEALMEEMEYNASAALEEVGLLGYKTSLVKVDEFDYWLVTTSGNKDHTTNPESMVQSRHNELLVAIFYNWYKIRVLWKDGSWVALDPESDFG